MEVVCGGECFTAAGVPCRRELWTLGVEKSLKGQQLDHCAGRGNEGGDTEWHGAVEILFLKPPGVPVETRWCIGAVHQIYLVINYTITEVTLICSECSIH
jgi:hypothetical protein